MAVNHNQLRTMASETVDPIDWLHPPPLHRAVPPELHVLHTAMRAELQITRLTALRERNEKVNLFILLAVVGMQIIILTGHLYTVLCY